MGVFVDTFDTIKRAMYRALGIEINKKIKSNSRKFQAAMRTLIPQWIEEQPEVQSLRQVGVQGSLAAQFGIVPGGEDAAIRKIVEALSDSIQTIIKPVDDLLQGGVEFTFSPDVLNSLLNIPDAVVVTEKNETLHWLNWLLTQGDRIIITGYHYTPAADGRSGGGVMHKGSVWRVPPEFSGTEENNFITRAFDGREAEIERLLKEMLE